MSRTLKGNAKLHRQRREKEHFDRARFSARNAGVRLRTLTREDAEAHSAAVRSGDSRSALRLEVAMMEKALVEVNSARDVILGRLDKLHEKRAALVAQIKAENELVSPLTQRRASLKAALAAKRQELAKVGGADR